MNRFAVLPGKEEAFEQRWVVRESKLEDMDGFLNFLLLRRPEAGGLLTTSTGVRANAWLLLMRAEASLSHRGQGGSLVPPYSCRSVSLAHSPSQIENKHSTDVEHPPPLPRVCMSIHTERKPCSDLSSSHCSQRPTRPAEDGYNYSTLTVWKDRAAFSAWRAASAASR
jgi:heme-degrading monooxygenase HmoA